MVSLAPSFHISPQEQTLRRPRIDAAFPEGKEEKTPGKKGISCACLPMELDKFHEAGSREGTGGSEKQRAGSKDIHVFRCLSRTLTNSIRHGDVSGRGGTEYVTKRRIFQLFNYIFF